MTKSFMNQYINEFSIKDFSNTNAGYKHNFLSIENIPKCGLFKYSSEPVLFEPDSGNSDFSVIHVPIKPALELLDDYCEIHSYKWHRVRKNISENNVINYPWLSIDSENEVFLMDGRHRLLGLLLLKGLSHAPVNVEAHHVEQITKYFELIEND